jgi:hypothetical protein
LINIDIEQFKVFVIVYLAPFHSPIPHEDEGGEAWKVDIFRFYRK